MSWKQRLGTPEPAIDPFNAPDPIMPGGEPDLSSDGARDRHDGIERIARRNEQKEPGHFRHRAHTERRAGTASPAFGGDPSPVVGHEPDDEMPQRNTASAAHGTAASADALSGSYQPPQEATQNYQAPTRRRGARRARPASTAGSSSHRKGRLGCIIALIIGLSVFANVTGALVSGCSAIFDGLLGADSYSDSDYDSTYSYSSDYDSDAYDAADDNATAMARTVSENMLAEVTAGEEPYFGIAKEGLEQSLQTYTGHTAEELGISLDDAARYLLEHTSYSFNSEPYAFVDETTDGFDVEASDYFHLSTPDYSAAALAASDYIWDNVPSSYTSDEPLPADVAAGAAAAFTSALESSSERELYLYVDLMGTADADGENVQLKFDRNAWEETFRTSVMGMY